MSSSQSYYTPASLSSAEGESTSSSKPLLTKCVRRQRLTEKMVKNLLARRYGSLTDFSQVVRRWCDISRATGMNPNTIKKAICTYHNRGNRFIKVNAKNFPVGRPPIMPPHLEARLTTKQVLYEMRFLSLERRCELIRREHGISIARWSLAKMYKRNGVRNL